MTERQKSNPAELADIDASWDDDTLDEGGRKPSARISNRATVTPPGSIEDYVREVMSGAADEEVEQKSGVQERDPISRHPTPQAGVLLDLPPLVTPEDRPSSIPLDIDEPGKSVVGDDLSLELDPGRVTLPDDPRDTADDLGTPAAVDPTLSDLRDRYAAGDFTGALLLAESVLDNDPNHADARRYAQSCRDVLVQMYTARLGPLDQVVRIAVPHDQIRWLSLDHRAGFLLSLVDGSSTMEELLDISGMPRLDALRIMFTLVEQQVIALERVP